MSQPAQPAVASALERFPADFMFELTREETRGISQFVTSSLQGDIKFSESVLAFTEHGVAMLSSVLRSPRAIEANIAVVRVFVRLRHLASSTAELAARLDDLERSCDRKFRAVFDAIREVMAPAPDAPAESPRRKIGFHSRTPGRASACKARPNKKVSP